MPGNKNIFSKKKILIYGLGKSWLSSYFFLKKNNDVYLYDDNKDTIKIKRVVKRLHTANPSIIVDGEIQANFALNQHKRKGLFPFSKLGDKRVNTLIFPNLVSGYVSYKILQELSNVETMGPVLLWMNKSAHILQLESSVNEIIHMATIASVDAHERK